MVSVDLNPALQGERALSGKTYEDCAGEYELRMKQHFDAAHELVGYDGPCHYLHGHTWDVEAVVRGTRLDGVGILYDFKRLKADLNAILDNFDHHFLNEVPPFDAINPTAENLARVIYYELAAKMPAEVSLVEISVWESPAAQMTYRPRA